jgi:hypothetical protein
MQWSYELLDERQRKVFDRCSVFTGSFTIDAAEDVVSGEGVEDWEVLEGILTLVTKSLVIADESSGTTRYYLLETMRQFGQANLSAAGTDERYRDRHADYYTDYVLSRRPQLYGSGDQAALHETEQELENIRLALRHAADDRSSSRFEELYSALYLLWISLDRQAEGMSWAMELKTRPVLDAARRIIALGFAASVANNNSLALAEELALAADSLSAAADAAPALLAVATLCLVAMMRGRPEEAISGCDRVIALAPGENDRFIRAAALTHTLAVLATCGVIDRVEDLRTDVWALAQELDNEYLRTTLPSSVAPIIHVVDPEHAGEFLLRGYEQNEVIRNRWNQCVIAMFLALDELRSGDNVSAAQWASRSLHSAVDYGLSYVPQTINAIVATVKRRSPGDAVVLLGALRGHRARRQQAGTQAEIDAESRYETSLRRQLGAEFDALYAKGLTLDETAMIALAFSQLDAMIDSSGEQAGS